MYDENEEKLTQILREYLERYKPYLVKLEKIVHETENGMIEVKLRVHNGHVSDLITTSVKRHKFNNPLNGEEEGQNKENNSLK